MGRYDNRTGSQTDGLHWDPGDAEDPSIRAWWGQRHVIALRDSIADFQWSWQFRCSEYVRRQLSDGELVSWAGSDPRIAPLGNPHYDEAWNIWAGGAEGLLNRFCWAHGNVEGLVAEIRPSRTLPCGRCRREFEEHSVPDNLLERLTPDQVDFCTPCLRDTLMAFSYGDGAGSAHATQQQTRVFVRRLAELTARIPPADFGYGYVGSLWGLSTTERGELLDLLTTRPSRSRIRELYGSWLGALIDAGVLENDAHQTVRGIRSIASDGHVCLSLGERTICEVLAQEGIKHEKEVNYPEGNYRADFRVGTTLIEYVGLQGDAAYDARTCAKQQIAARHGLMLQLITPKDLASRRALARRLRRIAAR